MISQDASIETVVLAASWQAFYYHLKPFDRANDVSTANLMLAATKATLQELRDIGKRVIVIKTLPQWSFDPLPCSIKSNLLRRECSSASTALANDQVKLITKPSNQLFLLSAQVFPEVRFISPADGLCAMANCITRINDEFIYFYAAYFRRNLSRVTAAELAKLICLDEVFNSPPAHAP
jgi:hypothetical protein